MAIPDDRRSLRKKRIAFLGGGAYTIPSYRALLNALSEHYDITLYFEFPREIKHDIKFSVRIVPWKLSRHRRVRETLFVLMILRDLVFGTFHIIHTHSTFPTGLWGVILGRIFRIPVVVSLDAAEASGLPELNFGDTLNWKRKKINTWVIKKANTVIALTEFLRREVHTNLGIDRKIEVIPRGVDLARFKYKEQMAGTPLKILNVAYLHPVKDQETLLKAFSIIRENVDSVLIHVGEDFSSGEIVQMVDELKLSNSVVFEGLIPNDQLPDKYGEAAILLHTSRYESQAVVVNEALACGLLVCGTHVGLLADLAGSCCLTVAPGDAEGLAKTVLELLNNPEEMRRLHSNGHNWAVEHDLRWTMESHILIYENLLKT